MIDTKAEALQEARKRWGIHAGVREANKRVGFLVGLFNIGSGQFRLTVKGEGASWDEAFANVDKLDK